MSEMLLSWYEYTLLHVYILLQVTGTNTGIDTTYKSGIPLPFPTTVVFL